MGTKSSMKGNLMFMDIQKCTGKPTCKSQSEIDNFVNNQLEINLLTVSNKFSKNIYGKEPIFQILDWFMTATIKIG